MRATWLVVAGLVGSALVVGCGSSGGRGGRGGGDRDTGPGGGGMDAGPGRRDTGPVISIDTGPYSHDIGPRPGDTGPRPDAEPGTCPAPCGAGETCCPAGIEMRCVPTPPGGECLVPDLTVSGDRARSSIRIEWQNFAADSCEIAEGCITTPGWRRVMRFDTFTPNIGTADMALGRPDPGNPAFSFSSCHGHYHFDGYADYRLLASDGTEVGSGHKQAFCLLDSERYLTSDPTVARGPRYNCGDQGIQRGWGDVYGAGLDCQWIDVTDVAPGDYTLRIHINYERRLYELSYDNNLVDVPVTIPPDTSGGDPLAACPSSTDGPSRDCGWTRDATGVRTCAPGAMVQVACSGNCTLGSCTGDPMIRICDGATACTSRMSITQNDDACTPSMPAGCSCTDSGRLCPYVTFTCPASGRYSVLTGAYTSGGTYGCTLATR